MHAEAHTCMHMQYFILLYILACTHKHTCASPRYRPYAGYCQHEHVIEHTQLYKTNSLISIQRKYAPKKKKGFLMQRDTAAASMGVQQRYTGVTVLHIDCPCKLSCQSQTHSVCVTERERQSVVWRWVLGKMRESHVQMQIGVLQWSQKNLIWSGQN